MGEQGAQWALIEMLFFGGGGIWEPESARSTGKAVKRRVRPTRNCFAAIAATQSVVGTA